MSNSLYKTNIAVTGATGMIGSHVVKQLLQKEEEITVVAFVRNMDKAKEVFSDYIHDVHLIIQVQDICEPIMYKGDIDFVVHAAGVTGGSKQHIDIPLRTINTAIQGTTNTLEFAREKESKGYVYLSSLEIYGKVDQSVNLIVETSGGYIDTMNVRSSYSESKRICECICAAYAKQYGLRTMVARLTATFGPGVSYNDGRVFAEFARSIIEEKDIVLKSTGETVRNYCDVADCADALILLLENGESGEAYNIANSDTEISIIDLAKRFVKLFPEAGTSVSIDTSVDATKFGYNAVLKTVLGSNKIQQIGWKPKYSLDETIVRLVESMKRRVLINEKI